MDIAKLGISIDGKDAVETLNTLADAAERASKALDELAGKAHGGIDIKVVGAVAHVEITPLDRIIAHGQAMTRQG